jgi:acetyl esterase/lipase
MWLLARRRRRPVPAPVGDARVRVIKPRGATSMLPVVVYMHGGGWILGNAGTHDRLVRELAIGARAALAFVEYPNSPEAHYPTAIEQGYATAQWITRDGASKGLDASRMAVAGESVGGNMTTALALMAKERGDVTFVQQSMYYPVTDAAMNTASYEEFATGYYLSRKAMEWFWDAYTTDPAQRAEITASPNQASIEQVAGLPPNICVLTRPTCCAMRGKPTPPSSAQRASPSRPCATTAPSTTSCCSIRSARPAPREPPSSRPPLSCAPGSEPAEKPQTAARRAAGIYLPGDS